MCVYSDHGACKREEDSPELELQVVVTTMWMPILWPLILMLKE